MKNEIKVTVDDVKTKKIENNERNKRQPGHNYLLQQCTDKIKK